MRRVGAVASVVVLCAVAACFAGDPAKSPEPRSWPMLAAERATLADAQAWWKRYEDARVAFEALERERPAKAALIDAVFAEAHARLAATAPVGSLGIALDRGAWVETAPVVSRR